MTNKMEEKHICDETLHKHYTNKMEEKHICDETLHKHYFLFCGYAYCPHCGIKLN
jgi:hypothetical protein